MSQQSREPTRTATVRPKEFHFPLAVDGLGERRVAVQVDGKQTLEIMPPPVFKGTDPTVWSPEDLLVASEAACLAVTFTGLAERAGLHYAHLHVDADGVCGRRSDGRFGFTQMTLRIAFETAPADAEEARSLAEQAEANCLVTASLDLPVDLEIEIAPLEN